MSAAELVDCGRCEGQGFWGGTSPTTPVTTCPECNGTGKIEAPAVIPAIDLFEWPMAIYYDGGYFHTTVVARTLEKALAVAVFTCHLAELKILDMPKLDGEPRAIG